MCILSYFPADVMPVEDHVVNGAVLNPNGHGYAIVSKGQISIFKSMDPDETIDRFMDARAKAMDGPAIFHSRIATSGLVDVTGCHPFHVGGDRRTVVAHNGILFNTRGDRSDTRVFAEDMMPTYGTLDRRRVIKSIEKYVGSNNKLVVLTVNPKLNKSAYLINEKSGHWDSASGAWHSNDDYLGAWWERPATKSTNYVWENGHLVPTDERPFKSAKESADTFLSDWECEVCMQRNCIDANDLVCKLCGSCADCNQHYFDCLCWSPGRKAGRPLAIEGDKYAPGRVSSYVLGTGNKYALNT